MVQPLKVVTLSIPADLYKKLCGIARAQQRTPAETLKIAIDLLSVALPHVNDAAPKPFVPRPRNPPARPTP